MENKLIANSKETISSLELVKQINIFRQQEGNRAELQHKTLLKIIRDEFEEEIRLGKISVSSYKNSQNKEQTMFILTLNQAKQVLMRESKFVRKDLIGFFEEMEDRNKKEMIKKEEPKLKKRLNKILKFIEKIYKINKNEFSYIELKKIEELFEKDFLGDEEKFINLIENLNKIFKLEKEIEAISIVECLIKKVELDKMNLFNKNSQY